MSHPKRVRESKPSSDMFTPYFSGVAPFAGARIEMEKRKPQRQYQDFAPHAGARIEIARFPVAPCFLPSHSVRVRESKCPAPENAKGLLPSHPARVRESKSGKCDYLGNPNVAPHAGARIEIQINPAGRCCRSSHLTRVRESKHAKLTCNTQVVAPIRVCESKYTIRRWCLCRTSRGCANRNYTLDFLRQIQPGRTLRGCANQNIFSPCP